MEYEDRRDADDAYHEMHNKRIGRDDVLKIEVCAVLSRCVKYRTSNEPNETDMQQVGSHPAICFVALRFGSRARHTPSLSPPRSLAIASP